MTKYIVDMMNSNTFTENVHDTELQICCKSLVYLVIRLNFISIIGQLVFQIALF